MSILFIVLGLGFLGGGAYAIVEGWPYILIERGFTLVIVGTVLMTAGVLMLALSRVMAELRRVRGQLSNAVMAVSVASMANARDEREPGPVASSGSSRAADGKGLGAGPVVLGGALAAGGAMAAGAVAAAAHEPSEARDMAATDRSGDAPRDDEPDLFATPGTSGTPAAEAAEPFAPILWPEPEAAASEARAEPLPVATPDEFETALAEATGEAELKQAIVDDTPMDDAFAMAAPVDDRDMKADFAAPELMSAAAIDEDFDRLRDRLALGGGPTPDHAAWDDHAAPTLAGERRDASESEIAAAADWMTAIRPGQERWFGTPPAPEPEVVSEPELAPATAMEPPVWPPQTREAAPFVSDEVQVPEEAQVLDEAQADGIVAPAQSGPAMPDLDDEREPGPLPTFAAEPEPEPEPDVELAPPPYMPLAPDASAEPEPEADFIAPPAPAASDEGVVGAYQVGTAHFTIYADGSIQARTPDGDYSFASMDELKTYLASEKNRLNA